MGGVNVAIVDTGVNDISITSGINFVNDTDDVRDFNNHGTIVAKIVKYFAPACNITALKITDNEKITETNVIKALDSIACNTSDFNIVNLSFAFNAKCNTSICTSCKLINLLEKSGILVIVAAGNNGPAFDTITCPGVSESALTIGALSQDGKDVAGFSSRGDGKLKKPTLIAPSYVKIHLPRKKEEDFVCGTSFSTPIVAGICASFYDKMNKNNKKVKDIVMRSLTKLGNLPNYVQGAGVIDVDKLIEVLKHESNNTNIEQYSHRETT